MPTFKEKPCTVCETLYLPTGPASSFCPSCAAIKKQESRERDKAKRRTGVGSGNSPSNRGTTHPNYKTGIGIYKKIRDWKLVAQNYKCSRCNTELDTSNPHKWCGHHIDHDRLNNIPSNIEVLCKRCHQLEHECWKAFEGATTIPKGSTAKWLEAPDTQQSEDIV